MTMEHRFRRWNRSKVSTAISLATGLSALTLVLFIFGVQFSDAVVTVALAVVITRIVLAVVAPISH